MIINGQLMEAAGKINTDILSPTDTLQLLLKEYSYASVDT